MDPIISMENVTKTFGRYISRARVTSLRDVSFEIEQGERVCLFGPNGAGKSTIMKIIMGLIKPTSGRVYVKGLDVQRDKLVVKRSIGYLPSELNFFLEVPCRESLVHFGVIRGLSWNDANKEADRLLEVVGLQKWYDLQPKLMSSGMRQRFSLALTIIADPDIILFDEPVSFIDVQGRMKINQLIQEYIERKSKTIIMSTHNIQEALILSDRIIVIDRGQIIADGPIAETVRSKCHSMEIILADDSPNIRDINSAIEGYDFQITGRKIFVKSENTLQDSIEIINKLQKSKIPIFSYRPLVEQRREKVQSENTEGKT
ncbi:MAG: ABC transporter ATP-binding protein [Candidatus Heimdallarchaeota archaeon]